MTETDALIRAKAELRLKARATRRALTPEQRERAHAAIPDVLLSLPEAAGIRSILAYNALPEELDLSHTVARLRENGIRIALPRVVGPTQLQLHWHRAGDALRPGAYGLLEPSEDAPVATLEDLDAVLTPGVAFDAEGDRLGFGAGYYDVLFQNAGEVLRIGIAYSEQIVERIPHEEHDCSMDIVVTPTAVYRRASR